MRQREMVIRVTKIDSRPHRIKKHGPHDQGRTCEVCGAELNTWNPGPRCIPHTHAVFTKYRAKPRSA